MIKRYKYDQEGTIFENDDGEWCAYEDYADLERKLEIAKSYMGHRQDCNCIQNWGEQDSDICSCGYEEALAAINADKGEKR
jgi:hypothetical protein